MTEGRKAAYGRRSDYQQSATTNAFNGSVVSLRLSLRIRLSLPGCSVLSAALWLSDALARCRRAYILGSKRGVSGLH